MPAMPKEIEFADIQVGDTIRVVEVNDVKVVEHRGGEIRTESGETYLGKPVRVGAERTFQLVERPLPELPTGIGSIIELRKGHGVWVLVYEVDKGAGIWINTYNGLRSTPVFMRSRVNTAGGFEVIR